VTSRSHFRIWSPEHDSRLIELYRDPENSIAQVAATMGRSESSVRGRLGKLRAAGLVKGRRPTGGSKKKMGGYVSEATHHMALCRIDELERQLEALRLRHGDPITPRRGSPITPGDALLRTRADAIRHAAFEHFDVESIDGRFIEDFHTWVQENYSQTDADHVFPLD